MLAFRQPGQNALASCSPPDHRCAPVGGGGGSGGGDMDEGAAQDGVGAIGSPGFFGEQGSANFPALSAEPDGENARMGTEWENGEWGQSPFSVGTSGQSPFPAVGPSGLPAIVLARGATCTACAACSPSRPTRNSAPSRARAGRRRARASAGGSTHPPYAPARPCVKAFVSSLPFSSGRWRAKM